MELGGTARTSQVRTAQLDKYSTMTYMALIDNPIRQLLTERGHRFHEGALLSLSCEFLPTRHWLHQPVVVLMCAEK